MKQGVAPSLVDARLAYDAQQWQRARALYAEHEDAELAGEDLHRLAWVEWLSGQSTRAQELLERAFAAHSEAGDKRSAALVALDLVRSSKAALKSSVANGWYRKAETLLAGEGECAELAALELMRSFKAQGGGDFDQGLEHAESALRLARKFENTGWETMALNRKGRLLIKLGRVAEGRALLDESMASAVGEDVSILVTGIVYCSTIDGCVDLSDFGRASDWTDAAEQWCEKREIGGFPGICRVHQAEITRLRGRWPEAEAKVQRACEELERFGMLDNAGAAHNELGELRLREGKLEEAEAAFRKAESFGTEPQPGLALLRLAQGKVGSALASIRRAVDELSDDLSKARLLSATVEIAVAADALDEARAAASQLADVAKRFDSSMFNACAASAAGLIALRSGEHDAAVRQLRPAVRAWQELDFPYECGRTRLLLAEAYRATGDDEAAIHEAEIACELLSRIGARLLAESCQGFIHEARSTVDAGDVAEARTLCTFMFTDIVQSTNLVQVLGDEAWANILRWHDATLRSEFVAHAGTEIKHTGDGFHIVFSEPQAAIDCAISIQRKLADHRRSHGFAPSLRIGLHETEATRNGSDFIGKGVHEAARIAALAGADEIIVSRTTGNSAGHVALVNTHAVELRGLSQAIEVGNVVWNDGSD